MIIYIIRHGETDLNVRKIVQGWADEPLNENGILLAKETGRALRGVHFDFCISSPLLRAKKTAGILLEESGNGHVPVRVDDRLKEINFGVCELTDVEKDLEEKGLMYSFFQDPLRMEPFPGGEGVRQVMERTQAFLREVAERREGEVCLLATHGCALRAMLNFLYDDPSDFWQGRVPPNCAVNILSAGDGRIRLLEKDKVFV